MSTFKEFYQDVSRFFFFRKYIRGGVGDTTAESPPRRAGPPPSDPAGLPLTVSHPGVLRRRAALWLLPVDDILVHCPLSVVGFGHGPGDLWAPAVRHDVDFGRVQRAGTFGTVRRRASWMVRAAVEKDRQRLQSNRLPRSAAGVWVQQ